MCNRFCVDQMYLQDMGTYRRSNIFERLLTLHASASLPTRCREKILQLLYRCTYVDGSTILITRCGLLSWIQIEVALDTDPTSRFLLQSLAKRAYETCDRSRVDQWNGGDSMELVLRKMRAI